MADNNTINFNQVQKAGTFGGIVDAVNNNFELAKIAILKMKGKSAYEVWKDQDGNENKSLDDFWAYLTADKGYTKQVLTYAEFQQLDPTTVSRSTIYIYPNDTNTEYYAKISNGLIWVLLLRNDGDITDLVNKVKDLIISVSAIKFLLNRKPDLFDTEEDGVFFTNENGEVFLKFDTNGLDASKVSDHLKMLVEQDLSEYAKITDIPEQVEVIKTTEEDGIYFTDGQGNVFIKYDNVNGLDVKKVSERLKSLITEGLIIPSNNPIIDIDEDVVSLVTNENGESAVSWSDEEGLDANKVSQHLKDLITDGFTPSSSSNPIQNIEEDIVSIVTNEFGESAVNWSNEFGLNANAVNYNLARKIKERKIKDMEEWFKLGSGMFIHWGVYSVLAGHYTGKNIDGEDVDDDVTYNAEWIMNLLKIPDATYKQYESGFTAANWNADSVARMAYDCGMKYIVITAKHHEGFTLYDSQYANWDIKSSGAIGKDPLMELKQSCEKYGLKFCLYFSQVRDWMAEGGFGQSYKTGSDPYTEAQHFAYINMTVNILKEMIGKYNPYVLWYDGPDADDKYSNVLLQSQLVNYPQVIVNWRLQKGYKVGDFATGEGFYFQGDRSVWKYAENCYTINGSWGYWAAKDTAANTYSLNRVLCGDILQSKCRNQNALINIGPKADGTVSWHVKELLRGIGSFVQKYGTFENTFSPNIYSFPKWGRVLVKNKKTLKLYVCDNSTSVKLDGILTKFIKSVRVYDIQDEYSTSNWNVNSDYSVTINNLPEHNDGTPRVIDIEFGNNVVGEDYSNILDDNNLVLPALAYDAKGAYIQVTTWDSKAFQMASWTSSTSWISTCFKYDGTTKDYKVTASCPSGSQSVVITGVVTDVSNGSTQTFTVSRGTPTSNETITLTQGKVYTVKMSHDGSSWVNLANISFTIIES